MKLSDSPSVSVSTVIAASLERVWEVVSDINTPASFSKEFQGAQWLSPAPLTVGSTFRGVNRRGDNEWDTTCTVTAWVANTIFTYVVEDVNEPVAIWSYTLSPEGPRTRLTFTAVVGPGESGLTRAVAMSPEDEERVIEVRLALWRGNMAATIAGMKALAEA